MTTATINCKYGSVTTPEVKLKTSSVNIKNLKDKNEEGSYKYPLYIKAFELFASSEAGKKYILRRSKSGFKYTGVFVDFEIKAAADGDFYNKGIYLTFQIC